MQTLTLEDGSPVLVVTDLAEDKVYMKFSNWWDQIVLHGALPFLVLAVSNIRWSQTSLCRASMINFYLFLLICLEGKHFRDNFYNE